jgi:hypothetical protein
MNSDALTVTRATSDTPRIAVLIPCYNEEVAIPKVVGDFQRALPGATIYVYDNNSSDATASVARKSGAVVRRESQQGKGNVVRRMFSDIEADVYVLVDGDDTYQAAASRLMIERLLTDRLDMVTGVRISTVATAYRAGHKFGNRVLTGMVRMIFGRGSSDMLSGYRVFSRRFVKSFPALASGFETETEFTVHALEMRMPIGEVKTIYRERPAGSSSKLNTYRDGLRILRMILQLVKEERPLQFFSVCGLILLCVGIALGIPVVTDFLRTGLVPRLPTAVLATGIILLSCLSFGGGLVLEGVTRGRMELKRLFYLSIPAFVRERDDQIGDPDHREDRFAEVIAAGHGPEVAELV